MATHRVYGLEDSTGKAVNHCRKGRDLTNDSSLHGNAQGTIHVNTARLGGPMRLKRVGWSVGWRDGRDPLSTSRAGHRGLGTSCSVGVSWGSGAGRAGYQGAESRRLRWGFPSLLFSGQEAGACFQAGGRSQERKAGKGPQSVGRRPGRPFWQEGPRRCADKNRTSGEKAGSGAGPGCFLRRECS